MSASTASLTTANHHRVTTRRRAAAAVGVGDDVINRANDHGDGVGVGVVTDNEISISNGHHHGTDSLQLKKSSADSVQRDHHHRKVPTNKAPLNKNKPRWATVASVLGKNMVLLIVFLGLLQMLRNHLFKTTPNHQTHDHVVLSRIAQTESLLKTTTKMMQAQVEVVDRKIKDQTVALRNELSLKIQDNALITQQGLTKIQDRTQSLENSLGELKAMNLMSRQDFDKFYDELNQNKDDDDNGVSLDEIRASLKEMIEKEFEKHSADGLGRVDYALASGGAMVVKHSEPFIVDKKGSSSWFPTRNGVAVSSHAHKMLSPSFGEPGQCFPLKGSAGFVQIMLRTPIIPQAFTLEHVSKSVAYDRSSAPKDCRVSGWLQDHHNKDDVAVEVEMFRLAEFAYDLEKSNNAQTFNALDTATSGVVNIIRLDFTSNHGSPSHTCIYRFRVHGDVPSSVSMLPSQS